MCVTDFLWQEPQYVCAGGQAQTSHAALFHRDSMYNYKAD